MIVKGYVIHLYCKGKYDDSETPCNDKWGYHWGDEYSGKNISEAKRHARQAGWKFVNGDVICPMCVNNAKDSL